MVASATTAIAPTLQNVPLVELSRHSCETSPGKLARWPSYSVFWGRFHEVTRAYMFAQIPSTARVCGARHALEKALSARPFDIGAPVTAGGPTSFRKVTVGDLTVKYRVCDNLVEVMDLTVRTDSE